MLPVRAIDGGDLAVWQNGFGLSGQGDNYQGDVTGDGVVSGADFLAWQTGYAAHAPATAVPEPAAADLLIWGVIGATALKPVRLLAAQSMRRLRG